MRLEYLKINPHIILKVQTNVILMPIAAVDLALSDLKMRPFQYIYGWAYLDMRNYAVSFFSSSQLTKLPSDTL